MKHLEYYFKATFNLILMSMPTWDFLDPLIKFVGACAGVVLTIVLIRKAIIDTQLAKEQRRKLTLENDIKNQELHRAIEENKRRFG